MPVSKKEALLKTLDDVTNPKEKVSVIHAAFGDKPHVVAFVEVEKEWTDTKKLEYAFMKTNSINEAWYTSEGVEYIGPEPGCRSTSVGDKVLVGKTTYVCESAGWSKV
tara:strand:+ start:299 stop:622 length:324 start_codon:yes stop_codon:yes gene_type:complete